jgi:hypothetical protein
VHDGVFWEEAFDMMGCENPFPVLYGAALKGKPFQWYREGAPTSAAERAFVQKMRSGVGAKPLRTGVVYQVHSRSRGSGSGSGRFHILADGSIENLSWDSNSEPATASSARP